MSDPELDKHQNKAGFETKLESENKNMSIISPHEAVHVTTALCFSNKYEPEAEDVSSVSHVRCVETITQIYTFFWCAADTVI